MYEGQLWPWLEKREDKNRNPAAALWKIGRTKEMNEANLAQHFKRSFLIQFVYQQTIANYLMKTVLFVASLRYIYIERER